MYFCSPLKAHATTYLCRSVYLPLAWCAHPSMIGCQNITDKGLKGLSPCSHLQKIILTGNRRCTGSGMRVLCRASRGLTHVVIKKCPLFNNDGLTTMSGCGVSTLDLSSCMSISDVGIRSLTEGSSGARRALRRINVCLLPCA